MPASSFLSIVTGDTSSHFIIDPTGEELINFSGIYNDIDDGTNVFDTPNGNYLLFNYELHAAVLDRNFNLVKTLYSPRNVASSMAFDRLSDVPTKLYERNDDTDIGFNLIDFNDTDQSGRDGIPLPSLDRNPIDAASNVLFTRFNGIDCLAVIESYDGSTYNMYLHSAKSGTRLYSFPAPDPSNDDILVDTPSYIIRLQRGAVGNNGISVFSKATHVWSAKIPIDGVNTIDSIEPGRSEWSHQYYATDTEIYFIYITNTDEYVFTKVDNLGTVPVVTNDSMGPRDFTWTAKFYRFNDVFAPVPELNKIAIRVDEYTDGTYNTEISSQVLIYDLALNQPESIIFTTDSVDSIDRVFRTKYEITGTVSGLLVGQTSTVCLLNRQGHVLHRVVTDNTGVYTLSCFSPDPQIVLVLKPNNVVIIHDKVVPVEA